MLLTNDLDAALPLGEIADIHGVPMMSTIQLWQSSDVPTRLEPGAGLSLDIPFLPGRR